MKHGFVKVAAVSPQLKVADVAFNAAKIIEAIEEQARAGTELLVFPELSLCGYTCGDLLLQKPLTDACLSALKSVAKATAEKSILVYVGLPVLCEGKLYNCAAAVSGGRVLGLIPKTYLPNYGEFYEARWFSSAPDRARTIELWENEYTAFSKNLLVRDKSHPEICVGCEVCEDLWAGGSPSYGHCRRGANLIVNLSASNETVGKREYRKTLIAAQSGKNACAYVYADAGVGESTSDLVFSGNNLIFENGILLAEAKPFAGEVAVAEIDTGYLAHERKRLNTCETGSDDGYPVETCSFVGNGELSVRKVSQTPFVPEGEELSERAELILSMQAHALARRMSHVKADTAVIGVSGGLDSTLALLVTARALDLLGKPRESLIAVTMPGFGTTLKTKNNSLSLMQAIGATVRTIGISQTVLKHFKDIGHDPESLNATYENAQARYRTMILMDLANETNGLVVGTGDLSELALGWCTYNGDHMSMYGVNASVPKTLVRHLVLCEGKRLGGRMEVVLKSVVNTEISPELLPPDAEGNIAQKTEDLVGPYELHDFFLYRILRCGDNPTKVYDLARYAFGDRYDGATVKRWLVSFYRRFFSQQFKRNCIPDGVKIGSVSLSPRGDWRMPSDACASLWLEEAKNL